MFVLSDGSLFMARDTTKQIEPKDTHEMVRLA